MPDKEGSDDEKKSTKSVVNKKQKQLLNQEDYLPEEGYDVARDEGKVKSSKDKKDATTLPVSDEVKKTQKKSKGKSAFEIVKAKYGKAVMDTKKEELDLTKVAEAFGGYIIEAKKGDDIEDSIRGKKKIRTSTPSLSRNIPKKQRMSLDDTKAQAKAEAEAEKRIKDAKQSRPIGFATKTSPEIQDTSALVRDPKTGEQIANPVETSKQTAEKKARVSTAGTGGKKLKNQDKFSTETGFEDTTKGKTKTSVTTPKPSIKPKKKTVTKPVSKKPTVTQSQTAFVEPPKPSRKKPVSDTIRTDLRTVKRRPSTKATPKQLERTRAAVAKADKIEIEKRTMPSKVGKGRIPVPRPEPLPKDVLKRVRKVTGRSIAKTQKQVKKIPKQATTLARGIGKAAAKDKIGAAVVVSTVADVLRGVPKIPKPPTPKGGKVGRRTAG